MRFFSGDNFLFRSCEQFFDLVVLSVLWAVLCVPVVTIGPATAALYYAVVKCVRRHEGGTLRNFFFSFKQNFKTGAVAGVILLAFGGMLFLLWNLVFVLAEAGDKVGLALYYAENVVILVAVGLACWVFPILSRFTLGVGGLLASAVKLGLKHLPTTIVVGLLTIAAAWFTLAYAIPILVVPGAAMLLSSLFYERVFKKYMPDAPDLPGDGEDGGEENRPWYLQ